MRSPARSRSVIAVGSSRVAGPGLTCGFRVRSGLANRLEAES